MMGVPVAVVGIPSPLESGAIASPMDTALPATKVHDTVDLALRSWQTGMSLLRKA